MEIYFCARVQLNKNIKLILNYILGPLVFIFLAYSIYHQLLKQPNWHQSWLQIKNAITGRQQWKIWMVILLMLVNWGLESKKWQLAIRPVQRINYWRSFCATLTGTTMASFTPNRMGEYLGRILYVEDGKRVQAISLTIVCSISQLLITMVAGCAGILYLQFHVHKENLPGQGNLHFWLNVLFFGVSIVLIILAILYFRLSWLVRLLEKIPVKNKFLSSIKVLEEFNATILLRILLLSFVRYLVFVAQYYLLFSVFSVSLTWLQTAGGISVVFLVMAVIPTFTFLTELGLRWEAGIQVIELFSANAVGIFAASFGIWLINLIIPALIGSLLILNIKLFKNR
jgi:MFS family permease